MATAKRSTRGKRKKRKKTRTKEKEQAVLSVISLRISDKEKERIDEIMRIGNIKRYSDVMRMAIHLAQVPNHDRHEHTPLFH